MNYATKIERLKREKENLKFRINNIDNEIEKCNVALTFCSHESWTAEKNVSGKRYKEELLNKISEVTEKKEGTFIPIRAISSRKCRKCGFEEIYVDLINGHCYSMGNGSKLR